MFFVSLLPVFPQRKANTEIKPDVFTAWLVHGLLVRLPFAGRVASGAILFGSCELLYLGSMSSFQFGKYLIVPSEVHQPPQ